MCQNERFGEYMRVRAAVPGGVGGAEAACCFLLADSLPQCRLDRRVVRLGVSHGELRGDDLHCRVMRSTVLHRCHRTKFNALKARRRQIVLTSVQSHTFARTRLQIHSYIVYMT